MRNVGHSFLPRIGPHHSLHKHGDQVLPIHSELFGEVVLVQLLCVLFGYFKAQHAQEGIGGGLEEDLEERLPVLAVVLQQQEKLVHV